MSNKNDRWSALSMKERADLMNMYITNGISDLKEMKKHYNSFAPGGPIETDEYGYPADITPAVITQDAEFNKFLMTLPDNQRLTPEEDYHTYLSWKLNGKPKTFQEAVDKDLMYSWDDSDNSYHGHSVAYDESTDTYYGLKPLHHQTASLDYDTWYQKGIHTLPGGKQIPLEGDARKEWEDFRKNYNLVFEGNDYKYVPRKHYNSFSGEEDVNFALRTPKQLLTQTLNGYIQHKVDSIRQDALEKSLNRVEGIEISYPSTSESLEESKKVLEDLYFLDPSFIGPLSSSQEYNANNPYYTDKYNQAKKEIENNCDYGSNCIGTATDNYPLDSRTVSTKDFIENFQKYGFVEVPFDQVLPGDITIVPGHGMIFDSYDKNGKPRFNYANGNLGPSNYRKQKKYPTPLNNYRSFRYVGTPELIQQWTKEYNNKKSSDGKILSGEENTNNNQKKLEAVMRSTNGITGQVFSKEPPFISFPTIIAGAKAYYKMKQDNPVMPSTINDYTGAAVVDGAFKTDGELGFATTDELISKLGGEPVDFIDSYVYNAIPFEEQGVIKKTSTPEKHIYRTKLSSMDKEVPVYQTHRDTLDTKLVRDLNAKLAKGQISLIEENFTHKDSPFQIGNTGIYYDGNNGFIARVRLEDGTLAEKALDIFDFKPSEWNYKVGKKAKEGLEFIDKNGHPYLMTSPWYYKKDTRTEEQRLHSMGITLNENGEVVRNVGDASGKVWDLYEALDYISSHPYETRLKNGKIL